MNGGGNMQAVHNYYYICIIIAIVIWCIINCNITPKKITKKKYTDVVFLDSKKASGILFGQIRNKIICSPSEKEGHVFVTGGSGSGKTSSILIPTLQTFSGTFFSIDISGDISTNVHKVNQLIYEPENINTIPYNILYSIDIADSDIEKDELLEQLAFLLMPESINMSDSALFYNTEGRKILTASLIAFYHMGYDFIKICDIIYENSWKDLFNKIDDTCNTKAMSYINSFMGANEQNTAGCKQQTDASIKLFAVNEKIKQSIRRPCEKELFYSPVQLEKYNVFVNIPDYKLELYAPLLHVLTAQTLEFFSQRPNGSTNTILFALDEFSSLGKLKIIHALRTLRKKHVRIMVLTQSFADIDLIYGKAERTAMMCNFKFKVILDASDTDTQEYYTKLIGQEIVLRHSTSRGSGKITTTNSESKDWIIDPVQFSKLGDSLILIHPAGYMLLKKNYYFKKGRD